MHGNHDLRIIPLVVYDCVCVCGHRRILFDGMVRPRGRVQKLRLYVYLGLVTRTSLDFLGSGWLSRMLLGPNE